MLPTNEKTTSPAYTLPLQPIGTLWAPLPFTSQLSSPPAFQPLPTSAILTAEFGSSLQQNAFPMISSLTTPKFFVSPYIPAAGFPVVNAADLPPLSTPVAVTAISASPASFSAAFSPSSSPPSSFSSQELVNQLSAVTVKAPKNRQRRHSSADRKSRPFPAASVSLSAITSVESEQGKEKETAKKNLPRKAWSEEEDKKLLQTIQDFGLDYDKLCEVFPDRTKTQLQTHWYYLYNSVNFDEKGSPSRRVKMRGRNPTDKSCSFRLLSPFHQQLIKVVSSLREKGGSIRSRRGTKVSCSSSPNASEVSPGGSSPSLPLPPAAPGAPARSSSPFDPSFMSVPVEEKNDSAAGVCADLPALNEADLLSDTEEPNSTPTSSSSSLPSYVPSHEAYLFDFEY